MNKIEQWKDQILNLMFDKTNVFAGNKCLFMISPVIKSEGKKNIL